MTACFNHAFSFGFSLEHHDATGDRVTASQLRSAILRKLAASSDTELVENCGAPFDTYEVTPVADEMRDALTRLVASCEEALDGRWDRTDDGFEAMRDDAELALSKLDEVQP